MSRVDKVSADLGLAGWNELLPERIARPELAQDIEADYAIVGAGFAGLAAARRIRQLEPLATIVILEAFEVATGPAGRNSGFMIDLPHVLSSAHYAGKADEDARQIKLNRSAIDFTRSVIDQYKIPQEAFSACGKTNAAASKSGLQGNADYARHLEKLGEPFEMLNAREIEDLCGSNYYLGGLKTPGTALIQPALYMRHFAAGLCKIDNCQLYEHSAVIELTRKQRRWCLKTRNGSVLAHKSILAVNGLVETFGYFRRRLMHINLYASMTRALTPTEVALLGGEENWGFTPSNPLGSTVRRFNGTGGDRLLIRNRCTYEPDFKLPSNRLTQIAIQHDRAFHARFPMLNEVEMEYRWSGRLCLSRNNAWALAEVDKGLYTACCQNGLGTTRGTIGGIMIAEIASEKTSDSILAEFNSLPIPVKLLPEPLMTVGAKAYLKFGEWNAGREL